MKIEQMNLEQAYQRLQVKKDLSSVELVKAVLEKIKNENPKLNAFLTVLEQDALAQAKASDERCEKGQYLSKIDGIPIAIKDNMAMENVKTTGASKILENFIAPYDATVVKKLKQAGAVIIGKTNLDEFAMGSSTENSAYGPTKNPHDLSRVPGGSSGGSAAAVAADMCLAALGSDTGGSIRQPASLCGIVGFKPTYGAISRYGLFAMASSLDQIGPMTKTVKDAEILFEILYGKDELDATSLDKEKFTKNLKKDITIGLPKQYFADGLSEDVKKIILNAVEKLKNMGIKVQEIDLPNAKYALEAYYVIVPVEVASNMARYDGIKYGFSAKEAQDLLDVYIKSRSKGFGAEVKRRIILGTYTSSAGYIDQYYAKAQKVRSLVKKDFTDAFSKVDFIAGPVMPTTAFKLGEKTNDPLQMYLSDIYTISVNLAGLPAISVPVGSVSSSSGALPVGLHLIGPQFSDFNLLELAGNFEREN